MIINSKALTAIQESFNTLFNKGVGLAQPVWEKFAMKVPSSSKYENYAWLGAMPKMKKWIGERAVKQLAANGYTLKNESYEDTVEVDRDDIEDDAYGVYAPLVQGMGQAATLWPEELVFECLKDGFEKNCYDGKAFFDEEHPVGKKKKVSNKTTAKLSLESYKEGRTTIMSVCDDEGKPLGLVPNLLIVSPALEETARRILKSELIAVKQADGSYITESNPYKDTAELLVSPRLADKPDYWFLLDVSKAVKPFVFQERRKPEFVAHTNPDNDKVFMEKKFVYGVDARGNAGYTLWQLAYGSTGTGA